MVYKMYALVLLFNYASCLTNLSFLLKLYKKHFKHIIVYSDLPKTTEEGSYEDVNYVNIREGYFTQRALLHFITTYNSLISECDGVFYTMDDNIINVRLLPFFMDSTSVLYSPCMKYTPVDQRRDWWWTIICNGDYGNHAISRIKSDETLSNFDEYASGFSDYFYMPSKAWLNTKFKYLLEVFVNANLFLEIAIPTAILNTLSDFEGLFKVRSFDNNVLWGEQRNLVDSNYIIDNFTKKNTFIIHPIKLRNNFELTSAVSNSLIENKRSRAIIITTIAGPTIAIEEYSKMQDVDVIIVCDTKTPIDKYTDSRVILLTLDIQKQLFPELAEALPLQHYSRKNLGYLYAIGAGYSHIFETDDDNIPKSNFYQIWEHSAETQIEATSQMSNTWVNIYDSPLFNKDSGNPKLWPRGLPLSKIRSLDPCIYTYNQKFQKIAVVQSLVDGEPDVDAISRLVLGTVDPPMQHANDALILYDNGLVSPFNTQATLWSEKSTWDLLYLPSTVSFRYTDILKSLVATSLLHSNGWKVAFRSPVVTQLRNSHDIMKDFADECSMYKHNEKILEYLSGDSLISIYTTLMDAGVVSKKELDILNIWISEYNKLMLF